MFEEFLLRAAAGDKAMPNMMAGGAVLQVPAAATSQVLSKGGGGAPAPQQVARVVMLPGAAPNVAVAVAPLRADLGGAGASVAGTTLTTKKAFVFAQKHKWMIAAAVLVCMVVIWVLFRMFYKKKSGENSKMALQARRDTYKAFFDEEEGGEEEEEEEKDVRQTPPSSKASVVQHLLDEPPQPRLSAPQMVKPPKLAARLPPRPPSHMAGLQPAAPTVSNGGAEALSGTVSAEAKPISPTIILGVPQGDAAAPRVMFADAEALETPLPPVVVVSSNISGSETEKQRQEHPTLQQAHAMQLRRAAREGAPPVFTKPPPPAAAPVAFDAIIELDDGADLPSSAPPAKGEGARRQRLEAAGDATMPPHRAGEQSGKRGGGRAEKELAIPVADVGGEARGKKGRRTTPDEEEEAVKEANA